MKHPQYILAFDKARFQSECEVEEGYTPLIDHSFLRAAEASLFIGRRHELEQDDRYWQLIPYVVIHSGPAIDQKLFTYKRASGIGDNRLLWNFSVGIGGHTDFEDVRHVKGVVDVPMTLMSALNRELDQEVEFVFNDRTHNYVGMSKKYNVCTPNFCGIICDNSNEVGRVHLGLVYEAHLPSPFVARCREEELRTVGMISPELLEKETSLENWSRIVLDNLPGILPGILP